MVAACARVRQLGTDGKPKIIVVQFLLLLFFRKHGLDSNELHRPSARGHHQPRRSASYLYSAILVNITASLLCPEYPPMLLVHTPDLDEAIRAGCKLDGAIARVIPQVVSERESESQSPPPWDIMWWTYCPLESGSIAFLLIYGVCVRID